MRTMREKDYIPPINMSFDEKEDDFDGFKNYQIKYSIFSNLVLIIDLLFFFSFLLDSILS